MYYRALLFRVRCLLFVGGFFLRLLFVVCCVRCVVRCVSVGVLLFRVVAFNGWRLLCVVCCLLFVVRYVFIGVRWLLFVVCCLLNIGCTLLVVDC